MHFLRHPIMVMAIVLSIALPFFSSAQLPSCYREMEINFFKPNLVNEALSLHSVPQSNWTPINQELQKNVRFVPQLVKERADRMIPNPFVPFQPQAASALLRSVLFEVFSRTLAVFHITNQNKVDEMFQYLRERQSQLFLSCFGEEVVVN